MPGASTRPSPPITHLPVSECAQASELSAGDVLQHLPHQGQVSVDFLQPAVLVVDRLQPTQLVGKQTAIVLLPSEVGHLADPGPPTYLCK